MLNVHDFSLKIIVLLQEQLWELKDFKYLRLKILFFSYYWLDKDIKCIGHGPFKRESQKSQKNTTYEKESINIFFNEQYL